MDYKDAEVDGDAGYDNNDDYDNTEDLDNTDDYDNTDSNTFDNSNIDESDNISDCDDIDECDNTAVLTVMLMHKVVCFHFEWFFFSLLFILEQFDMGRVMDGLAWSKYGIFFFNFIFYFYQCIEIQIEDDECIACI